MAKKQKYFYDPETLSYHRIKVSLKEKVRSTAAWIISTGIVWIMVYFIVFNFVPTPRELYLMREVENMKLNYEMLTAQLEKDKQVLAEIENRDDNLYRVIFETEPYSKEKRTAGIGGVNRYKDLEGYDYSSTVVDATRRVDDFTRRLYAQTKSLDEVVVLVKQKEQMLASLPAIQPVAMSQVRSLSGYGKRLHPISKTWKLHTGMDFTAKTGTPIYASGDGKVTFSGINSSGYGSHVIIDHGYGYQTLYGHMSKINVKTGQRVKRGEVLGQVGTTGYSTGPHLHYEVIKNGEKVNPMNYYYKDITPEEYAELLRRANELTSPLD